MTSKNYSTDVITAFKSVDNANKIIGYDADANAITKKAKATIYNGVAQSFEVATPQSMVDLLEQAVGDTHVALCLGRFKGAGEEIFHIRTKKTMQRIMGDGGEITGVQAAHGKLFAARLKEGIEHSHWILFDADNPPGILDDWAAMDIHARMELWEPLLPGLSDCLRIELRSSGSRVRHQDEPEKPASHALVQVSNPELIDTMKAHLQVEMLDGLSFGFDKHNKASGAVCAVENRSVFDLVVFNVGRLVFSANPTLTQDALDAGYVLDDANIQIINPDGGMLDISKLKMPTKKKLKEYSKKTESETKLTKGGKSLSSVVRGKLALDTVIDVDGVFKTVEEWLPSITPDDDMRCQTPFRPGSESMAGRLHHNVDGSVHLYDHIGVTYPMMLPKPVNAAPGTPAGYVCAADGVYLENDDPDKPGTLLAHQPVIVKALTRDENAENWGLMAQWLDYNGTEHQRAIPRTALHSRGNEVVQMLVAGGVMVVIGKEDALSKYLSLFRPKEQMISTSRTGWHGNAFVLPEETINPPAGMQLVYQPEGITDISKTIKRGGTFDEWKAGMAGGSAALIFFVCAKLAVPVRVKVDIEAGGFHGYDLTSVGKSTVLQAAASVAGAGGDPQIVGGDKSLVQRWNATSNSLEAKAEATSDIGLDIDELGEGDPHEMGSIIYKLLSGTGRGRSNRSGNMRDSKSWRTGVLSMGEIPVSDFIESGGKPAKGGQLVRMLDIDLSAMPALFPDAAAADAMKVLCNTHYGHALPEFLKAVPDLATGWKAFDLESIGTAISTPAKRALKRFALVAYTGCMAVDAGILPWTKEQVLEAVQMAYKAWHEQLTIVSDIDRGIESIKNFILKNEVRFQDDEKHDGGYVPSNRAGWKRDDMYHFIPSVFKDACGCADQTKVKKQLQSMRLLHTSDRRLTARIQGDGKPVTVVSVKSSILET